MLEFPLEVKCPICDGEGVTKKYPNDHHVIICEFCEGLGALALSGVKESGNGVFTAYGARGEQILCTSEERKELIEKYGDLWKK